MQIGRSLGHSFAALNFMLQLLSEVDVHAAPAFNL